MATTKNTLKKIQTNLDESMGLRNTSTRPNLSPVASPKDVGRRPLRNVARIEIEQVIPDPSQPRTEFSNDSIDRLARNIKSHGQLAPIRVRWSPADSKWMIVCGERRWRAVSAAGLKTIECCFVDGELSDAQKLEQQLVENLLRDDLKPIEQARGFTALMELHGWNGKQVAESLNIPASTVSRALSLLDLPPAIQKKVDSGEIAARSAYEISKVDNNERQLRLAENAAQGMTIKQTQDAIRKRRRTSRKQPQKRLEFLTEHGWKIVAIPPQDMKLRTYHHLKEAIEHVTEDVLTRINSNIRIA